MKEIEFEVGKNYEFVCRQRLLDKYFQDHNIRRERTIIKEVRDPEYIRMHIVSEDTITTVNNQEVCFLYLVTLSSKNNLSEIENPRFQEKELTFYGDFQHFFDYYPEIWTRTYDLIRDMIQQGVIYKIKRMTE